MYLNSISLIMIKVMYYKLLITNELSVININHRLQFHILTRTQKIFLFTVFTYKHKADDTKKSWRPAQRHLKVIATIILL